LDRQASYIQVLQSLYPNLEIETAHLNQNGQFNDILIINDKIIFRFPKTMREAGKLVTECAVLWSLQGRMTLPIPNPIYRSRVTETIGHVFMGYHMLPGMPLWPQTLCAIRDETLIQHLADQLATFLRVLHATPAEALEVKLPDFRGCEEWQELYERFRDKLFRYMRRDARAWTTRHFEEFLSDPRNCDYAPAFIHGDFGPSNILYDAGTKSISGIIDFSSAGWGDPATDFAAILCSVGYGEEFLQRFSATYPGIEQVLSRARFYAGTFALQEALYGLEDHDWQAFERGIAQYR